MRLSHAARLLSHHLHHQQVPHWHTVFLSLRLLSTAPAHGPSIGQEQHHFPVGAPREIHLPLSCPSATSASQSLESNCSHSVHSERQQQPCNARLLDGKSVAAAWSSDLQQQVQDISRLLNRRPGLAVILVGSRPDSCIYVSRKQEACRSIGVHCRVLRLPEHVSQADLQACLADASADRAIDGVLVQLPLPSHLDEEAVMEALDPRKDVDGFHPLNMGRMLMRGRAPRFVPATPLGVVELLSRSGVALRGKTAVVVGDSNIVGTPIAALLRDAGVAMVTTCHRVSLQNWLEQQTGSQPQRAAALDVCLPRLFGPSPVRGPAAQAHTPLQHIQDSHALLQGASSAAQQQDTFADHFTPSSSSEGGFQASDLPAICRTADILVVAVGSPELITAEWVKPGAVVVDVGINVVPSLRHQPSFSQVPQQQQPSPPQQQQQPPQQQEHTGCSGLRVAQGSMPQHPYHGPPCPPNGTTSSSNSDCGTVPSLASSGAEGGASSDRRVVCKPQVQLQLVQTDTDGVLSLSSDYRVVGDVAHQDVARVASVLTPVPGGVGPMTIAAVLHNTLQAAKYTAGLLAW